MHLIDKIKKVKNIPLRTKIKNILLDKKEFKNINIFNNDENNKLFDILINYKNTYYKIINTINIFKNKKDNLILKNNSDQNKKIKQNNKLIELNYQIIEWIDNNYFDFDKDYIDNILNLPLNELKNKIDGILQSYIIHKDTNSNYKIDILMDMNLCKDVNDSYYCQNKKLIISKSLYKDLLDIISYDITNDFKKKILFNLTASDISNLKFDFNLHEKIFIYQ